MVRVRLGVVYILGIMGIMGIMDFPAEFRKTDNTFV